MEDALRYTNRSSFDPAKKLNVMKFACWMIILYVSSGIIYIQVLFLGEDGSDGGGLTREFFRLIACHVSKYIEASGCFKHDSVALQV